MDATYCPQTLAASGSVARPRVEARKVVPWTGEQVVRVRAALPEQYAILVDLGAGLGLRQGEAFGVAVEVFGGVTFAAGCSPPRPVAATECPSVALAHSASTVTHAFATD